MEYARLTGRSWLKTLENSEGLAPASPTGSRKASCSSSPFGSATPSLNQARQGAGKPPHFPRPDSETVDGGKEIPVPPLSHPTNRGMAGIKVPAPAFSPKRETRNLLGGILMGFDGERYIHGSKVVMPNHPHLLFRPLVPIEKLIQVCKRPFSTVSDRVPSGMRDFATLNPGFQTLRQPRPQHPPEPEALKTGDPHPMGQRPSEPPKLTTRPHVSALNGRRHHCHPLSALMTIMIRISRRLRGKETNCAWIHCQIHFPTPAREGNTYQTSGTPSQPDPALPSSFAT